MAGKGSMSIRLNITGLNEIIQNMNRILNQTIPNTKRAIQTIAEGKIVKIAQDKLTSDGHILTGALRASITAKVTNTTAEIGSPLPYARRIEFIDSYLMYALEMSQQYIIPELRKAILNE